MKSALVTDVTKLVHEVFFRGWPSLLSNLFPSTAQDQPRLVFGSPASFNINRSPRVVNNANLGAGSNSRMAPIKTFYDLKTPADCLRKTIVTVTYPEI